MTGHVVRDLPAALGFAAVVAAVAAHPPAVLSRAPLRGLGTISYGLYLWHLPVLLWLRFQGLMPGGFVLPWLEVAALSALVGVRELGVRRAASHRGGRPLAPVDAARPVVPGRAAHQAGAERGVRRATTVSGSVGEARRAAQRGQRTSGKAVSGVGAGGGSTRVRARLCARVDPGLTSAVAP